MPGAPPADRGLPCQSLAYLSVSFILLDVHNTSCHATLLGRIQIEMFYLAYCEACMTFLQTTTAELLCGLCALI